MFTVNNTTSFDTLLLKLHIITILIIMICLYAILFYI